MTLKEIEDRIKEIRRCKGDDENQHMLEELLRRDFLRYIATLETPLALKAQIILKTEKINFHRWYA